MRAFLIFLAIVCLAIAVFYFIPGIHHPLTFNSGPDTDRQLKHSLLFLGLTIIALIASRFVGTSKQS